MEQLKQAQFYLKSVINTLFNCKCNLPHADIIAQNIHTL